MQKDRLNLIQRIGYTTGLLCFVLEIFFIVNGSLKTSSNYPSLLIDTAHGLLAVRFFQLCADVTEFFLQSFVMTDLSLLLLLLLRRRHRCRLRCRHLDLIADFVELSAERPHVTLQLKTQLFRLLATLFQLVRLQPSQQFPTWVTFNCRTFKFPKVVRQQNSGAVEDFILPYSAVYLRIQNRKNY